MSVFRDIPFEYRGKEYAVTPSVRLLRMVEARGRRDDPAFNLAMSVYRIARGDVSYGDACFIVAEMINAAGGKTTADEAWEYMQGLDREGIAALIASVVECFIDPKAAGKKPDAPETKAA
jgi:hypothetical protein